MLIFEDDGCHRPRRRVKSGAGIANTLINKLPFELHIPGGYQFCGPGTKVEKRVAAGQQGINPLDAACRKHDLAYLNNSENLAERHKADYELEQRAWERVRSKNASVGEKAAAWLVTSIMKAKRRFGMGYCLGEKKQQRQRSANKTNAKRIRRGKGLKNKSGGRKPRLKKSKKIAFGSGIVFNVRQALKKAKREIAKSPHKAAEIALLAARKSLKDAGGKGKIRMPRVIPLPKVGGILPLLPIFAGLSALGTVAGGIAGVSKAVNDARVAREQMSEAQRHNKTMEAIALKNSKSGSGLYLKPHRHGVGLFLKPQYPKKLVKNLLLGRPLTDDNIKQCAALLGIPNFRDVFMRDNLPTGHGPMCKESAVVNLDSIRGAGTHWVAYRKDGDLVCYYDSFGDLPPPLELVHYLQSGPMPATEIKYNYSRQQDFNTVWCGHLCLKFLSEFK
ncbi:hypothetical protein NQ315_002618 [Exocentrus adspersus]|uniref:Phospholipase A2-like domain-containing protein n=1 Tax=Exocentrus adspersus TaxID=1586481 RepID=A0AAV8VU91_9CUCU|nr:hypothetical protein NQ315_002618 [Exocentrus adspersus]